LTGLLNQSMIVIALKISELENFYNREEFIDEVTNYPQ